MARELTTEEFEELYRTTAPELFGYLRRRAVADPEDLVAEVFVVAWRRRADLPGPLLRRAWLFGIARKLLLADARARTREEAALAALAPLPDSVDPGAGSAGRTVTAALARLAPADREIITLVEWERLTPAEVAVTLGIRPGTARVRLHRARQALAADPELARLLPSGLRS